MSWKRTRASHRDKQDPLEKAKKLADLEMLQWAAAAGAIDLFYLDESGFCPWMPTSYSYFFRGEQKRLEQTPRQGATAEYSRPATADGELHLRVGDGQL